MAQFGRASQFQQLNQREQIYAAVKQALMVGDLKPGETLAIGEVAAHFSVSAMPVREAMLNLAAEGLLENDRKKAARVPEMSLERFRELATIRCAVEGLAVKQAALQFRVPDIQRIRRINEALRETAKAGNVRKYLHLNADFHTALYSFCKMPTLLVMIQRLMAAVGPPLRNLGVNGIRDDGEDWHSEILKALEAADGEAASRALAEDIASSVRYLELRETKKTKETPTGSVTDLEPEDAAL